MPAQPDSSALILGHITAGTTVPAGDYYIENTIIVGTTGKTLFMDPDAVLIIQESGVFGQAIIRPYCAEFTIEGGTLRGDWDMALQGNDAIEEDPLLKAAIGIYHSAFRKLTLRRVTIERFAAQSMTAGLIDAANPLLEFVFDNCTFRENFRHFGVTGYGANILNPIRLFAVDTLFGETARPATQDTSVIDGGTGFPVALNGGNHIGSVNCIMDVEMVRCKFQGSGRMCIELYRSAYAPRDKRGMVRFTQCEFARPFYRSLSLIGVSARIIDCWFHSGAAPDGYIELLDPTTFHMEGCEVHGLGIFWPGFSGSYTIQNNQFYDTPEHPEQYQGALFFVTWQSGGLEWLIGKDQRFEIFVRDNTFTFPQDPGEAFYAINRFQDDTDRGLALGASYVDEGNVYNDNSTARPNYAAGSQTYAALIPRGAATVAHRNAETPLEIAADAVIDYLPNGNYTVTISDSETTPVNFSWKEREASSTNDRATYGTIKNFYWPGSGSKTSPEIAPAFDSFEIHDMRVHDVTPA